MRDLLLVVDGNSLLHRAFHALPALEMNGIYTNAVHGFLMMLLRVIRTYAPAACAVAFDESAPTFRHRVYAEYKAGRAKTPPEMKMQFPIIREVLEAMGLGVLSAPGWEADDILGTCARACGDGALWRCMLLTGDRDALQLVDDSAMVLFTRKGITDTVSFTPAMVHELYGIRPDQVTDWKGLMGDASDNIPGIPGVGEKTAVKLLDQYGTLENVLSHADEIKGKLGERVRQYADQARFSKELARIRPEAPIRFAPEEWPVNRMRGGIPCLEKYHLNQVIRQLGQQAEEAPAQDAPEAPDAEAAGPEITVLADAEAIRRFLAETDGMETALHLTSTALSIAAGNRLGLCAAGGDLMNPGLSPEEALGALREALPQRGFIVHDGKKLCHILHGLSLPLPRFTFDTMLGQYLLSPQEKSFSLSAFERDDAFGVLTLCARQRGQLAKTGMTHLMDEIEMPLQTVLYDMETEGFLVNAEVLRSLGSQWKRQAEELKEDIYRLTGVPGFNLNSPQQLGKVLFETLGLKGGKKNSRGYSTDADTLEGLRDAHPAIEKILEYRQVVKLTSTYIDALIDRRDADGRIRSVFDQTGTVTGRISSSEPNLQNIPVRTPMGREIRRAFVPREGWKLCDADYSQIELRVLAHLSGDENMIDAFRRGQDIHARTASEVYGVAMDAVTPEMRRSAKAVNFGLVYGISEFGLARNLGISRAEAHGFIERYFERYPGIRAYMTDSVARGRADGYTETLFRRRRPLPELRSPNGNIRAFGERVAMNAPVQGTAADIIKLAMIRVHGALKERGLRSRLILQVHDELLIECPPEEEAQVMALLKDCMENACEMRVPLTVEVKSGGSWYETK